MPTFSPPWLQLPITTPIGGIAYWVTPDRWCYRPFVAVWIAATLEWEVDILLWRYPWYITPWYRMQ